MKNFVGQTRLLQGDLYKKRAEYGPYLSYNPYLQEKNGYKILTFANTIKKEDWIKHRFTSTEIPKIFWSVKPGRQMRQRRQ